MNNELELPSVRKLFIPDPRMIICDVDLSGADAQVVAWDAEDEALKAAFRAGADVHALNASAMFGSAFDRLSLDDPERGELRQKCKHAVHGTNYVGSARAVAQHPAIRWTVHEAEQFQRRWFSLHPAIPRWHRRIERSLATTRSVQNAFGYSRIYYDRIEQILPEAVAWIPQSTVALNTRKSALAVRRAGLPVEWLLQVHDSLVFQLPADQLALLPKICQLLHIPVPYADPLVIPWGLKISSTSWGACKKASWEQAAEQATVGVACA